MKVEINVNDYLTEEEIKSACVEAVKSSVMCNIKEEKDLKRIISNSCYESVWNKIDEEMDGELEKHIKAKIKSIISKLTEYTIFRKPDAWDREPNNAYLHLQKCIVSNFPKIEEVVGDNIAKQTLEVLREDIGEFVADAVQKLFVAKGE